MLVYVAVTKEFTMIFLQRIRLPSVSQKNIFGKNYTLVDAQIHSEYNEQRCN